MSNHCTQVGRTLVLEGCGYKKRLNLRYFSGQEPWILAEGPIFSPYINGHRARRRQPIFLRSVVTLCHMSSDAKQMPELSFFFLIVILDFIVQQAICNLTTISTKCCYAPVAKLSYLGVSHGKTV